MAAKKRKRRVVGGESGDIYKVHEPRTATFSTGCTLLDCVMGGGYAYGRMTNIIGDKSTGKTLQVIEAGANFIADNPNGLVVYGEAEAAFDQAYAQSLGLPLDRVEFPELQTIEDWFEDMNTRFSSKHKTLYIVDSLDALSDREEQGRDIDKGSYAMGKTKKLSELFRRNIKKMQDSNVTLIVVSQVRDNIGAMFGKKHKRSGGHAMDFYATHTIWLSHLKRLDKTHKGVKRAVGVRVKAMCEKNKIGPPFRSCEYPLMFGYGVEDVQASLEWLIEVKRVKDIGMTIDTAKALAKGLHKLSQAEYDQESANINLVVKRVWAEIEEGFAYGRSKYAVR